MHKITNAQAIRGESDADPFDLLPSALMVGPLGGVW